jgi:hypothetical protein
MISQRRMCLQIVVIRYTGIEVGCCLPGIRQSTCAQYARPLRGLEVRKRTTERVQKEIIERVQKATVLLMTGQGISDEIISMCTNLATDDVESIRKAHQSAGDEGKE